AGRTPLGAPSADQAQACLHSVLAYLALQAGDTERRAAECARTVTPALTVSMPRPSPWVCADWATYQAADYGFALRYPRRWGGEGFEQCGVQRVNGEMRVGSRIELVIVPSGGVDLSESVRGFLAQRDWRIESVDSGVIGGREALMVNYRFGGLDRFGTATLVER